MLDPRIEDLFKKVSNLETAVIQLASYVKILCDKYGEETRVLENIKELLT